MAARRVETWTRCASATLSKREEANCCGENMLACVKDSLQERYATKPASEQNAGNRIWAETGKWRNKVHFKQAHLASLS